MVRSREHGVTLLVALVFGLLLLGGPLTQRFEALELGLFDLRMSLKDLPTDPRIRAIGLDEGLGSAGWDERTALRLLGLLREGGVRGVYVMDAPGTGWASLGASLEGFSVAAVREAPGERDMPPGALPTGTDYVPEPDGAVRRVSLAAPGSGQSRPGPALLLLAALEGVPTREISFGPDFVQVGPRRVPTDSSHRIWVHFQEGARSHEDVASSPLYPISAERFLKPDAPVLGRLDGTVALLGNFATEARDEVLTAGGTLRALQVETSVLDTLLSGHLLHRPPRTVQGGLVLALALALAYVLPLLRIGKQVLVALAVGIAWFTLNLVLFWRGLWLDLAAPEAALVVVLVAAASLQFARSTRLLGQFLAPDMARDVLRSADAARLGGQEKVCTIMFFSLPPCLKRDLWDAASRLERRNQFTAMAAGIIEAHGGRVMDFQGDAQMVLFGAPRELPNHAAAATAAALEILSGGEKLLDAWEVDDAALRDIHAGVCTGPLAVGFVGSERHKEFAAIGDTTNVAARLYAAAIKMGVPVLVSGTAVEAAGGAILADPLPPVELKGKTQPVPVFQAREVKAGMEASR